MFRRKFLAEILVASPLVLLCAMGIEGRTSTHQFEPYAYTNSQNEDLRTMRPILVQAQLAIQSEDAAKKLAAAEVWIEGRRIGWLPKLRRANFYDSSRSGIKGQISEIMDRLACELIQEADHRIGDGDIDGGLLYAGTAIELTEPQKFTDVDSIGYFAMRQRSALASIDRAFERMSATQLKQTLGLLGKIDLDPKELYKCALTADRLYTIDGLRWNEARSRILDPYAKAQLSSHKRSNVGGFSIANLEPRHYAEANSILYSKSSLESERVMVEAMKSKYATRLKSVVPIKGSRLRRSL